LAPTTMSINIARHAINRNSCLYDIATSPMTAPVPVVTDSVPSDGLCQVGVLAQRCNFYGSVLHAMSPLDRWQDAE
jgi:hypothetical protein